MLLKWRMTSMFMLIYLCSCSDESATLIDMNECQSAYERYGSNKATLEKNGYGDFYPMGFSKEINAERNCIEEGTLISCGHETRMYEPLRDISYGFETPEGRCMYGKYYQLDWKVVGIDTDENSMCPSEPPISCEHLDRLEKHKAENNT